MLDVITGQTESFVQDAYGRKIKFTGVGVTTPATRLVVAAEAPVNYVPEVVEPPAAAVPGTPGSAGDVVLVVADAALYVCLADSDGTVEDAWKTVALTAIGA